MTQTTFPLEKILEVDIDTYFKTRNSVIGAYDLVGVRYEGAPAVGITHSFANLAKIPENAEVVVNYHIMTYIRREGNSTTTLANAYGTALVPKK